MSLWNCVDNQWKKKNSLKILRMEEKNEGEKSVHNEFEATALEFIQKVTILSVYSLFEEFFPNLQSSVSV